jgi:hypothetical protein
MEAIPELQAKESAAADQSLKPQEPKESEPTSSAFGSPSAGSNRSKMKAFTLTNPYNVKCESTAEEVKIDLPHEYKKALEKVERRGWINTKWDRGYTLLHWAARQGKLNVCQYLMANHDAPPDARDDKQLLPYDHAKKKQHHDVMDFFEKLEPTIFHPPVKTAE